MVRTFDDIELVDRGSRFINFALKSYVKVGSENSCTHVSRLLFGKSPSSPCRTSCRRGSANRIKSSICQDERLPHAILDEIPMRFSSQHRPIPKCEHWRNLRSQDSSRYHPFPYTELDKAQIHATIERIENLRMANDVCVCDLK